MEYYGVIHPRRREILQLCSTALTKYTRYYAFPAILHRDRNTLLVVYKDGVSHGWDPANTDVRLSQLMFDVPSQCIVHRQTLWEDKNFIPQMGEYAQMPNGDICVYVDMQSRTERSKRTGMEMRRSVDGGNTYGPSQKVGIIDGVEYGYPLNFCERNGLVYMLAMTFPYLNGSKNDRQVHVVSSDNNGFNWRFEANLTESLKLRFNESTLVATKEGFVLFTRGESARHGGNASDDADSPACLVMLDKSFKLLRMRDCRATRCDFSQVGRPRLYQYNGKLLLITRQFIHTNEGMRMALDLFIFDPDSFEILARFRLDDPVADTQDGHYANLYLDETGQKRMLRVIDYETCPTPADPSIVRKPDIVQYSFCVDELIEQCREEVEIDF